MVSLDDHSNYTTTELMRWDQPSPDHSGGSGNIEVMEADDVPSDEEMGSGGKEPEGHTQDSSISSESESSTKSGDDSDHNSDHSSGSDCSFHPGSDLTQGQKPNQNPAPPAPARTKARTPRPPGSQQVALLICSISPQSPLPLQRR